MNKNNLKKIYQTISWLLKFFIIAGAIIFLYDEIFRDKDVSDIRRGLKAMIESPIEYGMLSFVLALMPLNWLLEAYKWKILIDKIEVISLLRSLKAVFSGITVSVFTPNRIGEYGGRIFHLQTGDRIKAVLVTIIGSWGQLTVTVCAGLVGLAFYVPQFTHYLWQHYAKLVGLTFYIPQFTDVGIYLSDLQLVIFGIFCVVVIVLIVLLYLNIRIFSKITAKWKWLGRYVAYSEVFNMYNSYHLGELLFASLARYFVFTLQFYLLLKIFGVNVNYAESMMMISIIYLVMAGIPTIAIAELGVRGSIAVFIFGAITDQSVGIIAASFALWLINIAIPAGIGTFFVFNLRFFRNSE